MNTTSFAPVEEQESRRERRRLVLGAGILAVSLLGLSSVATGAFFTDSAAASGNTFTTGTVKIGATTPAATSLSLGNMAPGDSITAPVTVANNGSLALRYAVVSTSDAADANTLAAQLKMTVKTGITAANCTAAGFTGGTAVYTSGVLGSTAGTKVLGDSATGAQTGDRNLSAGVSEVLCVQVSLPTSTDNTFQNKTTSATFTFNAEQTANNA